MSPIEIFNQYLIIATVYNALLPNITTVNIPGYMVLTTQLNGQAVQILNNIGTCMYTQILKMQRRQLYCSIFMVYQQRW